ncbi:sigma-70 family RNA polymerase sigma factor [Pseudomonas sp.]|uniref:sigma-70 family RNA polymerase sigma factor n=1 Tax=Pseudomonas sp. TaxID=306 RepID=UPI0028B1F5DE|nr:sigma-70 family RNA polymerase sigma factor [Pseudomonas sp.]
MQALTDVPRRGTTTERHLACGFASRSAAIRCKSKERRMAVNCVLEAWRSQERALAGYLIRRSGDPSQVDDLLQEVFIKALREGSAFCQINNPRAWLFRVARNALIDAARTVKVHVELPEDLVADDESCAPVDKLDGCLARNLAELSMEDRQILEQCDLQGVKQQDFAVASGLTLPAAKARLRRARRRLRESITRNCQVRFDESGRVCCHVPREESRQSS